MSFGFDSHLIAGHLARLVIFDHGKFGGVRREIGEFMRGEIQDNLDGQKLFDGSPMPQSKAAVKRRGKTLIKDHHLYDSYTYNLIDSGLEVGSEKVYAAIHHFGGETGRPGHRFTLQARPVMGIGPRQELAIGDYVFAAIRRTQ
nr:phage virion morphogenesis protein [Rhodoferax fermentans]